MKSVLIIGGGVIGLCSAYYTAQRGHKVTVLDRNPEEYLGCSFGNAGMIVPSHFVPMAAPGAVLQGIKWMPNPESPFWIKPRLDWDLFDWGIKFWRASNAKQVARAAPILRDLNLASRALFEELAAVTNNQFGLEKKGLLMLCHSEHALEEEGRAAEKARALGIPAEVLNSQETAALDPNVRMSVAGAVYFPMDCHLSPHSFMTALRQHARKAGVEFLYGSEVLRWKTLRNVVEGVQTGQGDLQADEYVLCSGAWSSSLAEQLGLKIPLQAGKGYSLTVTKPRQLPSICSIFTEARIAVTPMGGTLRFGGTLEMAGLNEEINTVRVNGIIKAVPKYYPDFHADDFKGIKPWSGLRPCSPDGLPYLGRTSRYNNLCLATGHAMMGLSLGPITGKIVAGLLANEKPEYDLSLLNPDRFGRL